MSSCPTLLQWTGTARSQCTECCPSWNYMLNTNLNYSPHLEKYSTEKKQTNKQKKNMFNSLQAKLLSFSSGKPVQYDMVFVWFFFFFFQQVLYIKDFQLSLEITCEFFRKRWSSVSNLPATRSLVTTKWLHTIGEVSFYAFCNSVHWK